MFAHRIKLIPAEAGKHKVKDRADLAGQFVSVADMLTELADQSVVS